jgi:hypothetical protein
MSSKDLRETLQRCELLLLSPEVRASEDQLDQLLADAFIEFGSSGRVFDKAHIMSLLTETPSDEVFTLRDFRLLNSDEQQALAVYSCDAHAPNGELLRVSNRSSLWVLQAGRWQLLFHQGTIAA